MHRLIAIVAVGMFVSPAPAEDWPTYAHDIRRSGRTSETLPIERLGEAWRFASAHPPAPAWYGPAKWDAYSKIENLKSMRNYDPCFHVVSVGMNTYFASSVDDTVRCVDARTGKVKWLFTTGGPVRIAPMFVDGLLYFGSDDGFAYCVRAADGKAVWKASASDRTDRVLQNGRLVSRWPVRTGVLVDGGTAYFAGSLLPWEASFLCAVDAKTGAVKGEGRYRTEVSGDVTFEGPLLASTAQLIAPQGRVAPLLFDRATGKTQGSVKGGGGSFVLLAPDKKILHGPGNKQAQIYTTDPANKKAKIASFEGGNAIVIDGDRTYLLADNELVAVDRKERRRLWAAACAHPLTMVMAGDTLIAGGVNEVGAYDAETGEPRWASPVIGRAYGLAVANGALYVSTDEGVVHCFRAGGKGVIEVPRFGEAPPQEAVVAPAKPVIKTQPLRDVAVLGRWVFQKDAMRGRIAKNLAGGLDAPLGGGAGIERVGDREAVALDGKASGLPLSATLPAKQMPTKAMTVEAWVRIDKTAEWGGIVSALQDDGDKEFGWLLGYRKDRLCFAVRSAASKKLTYMSADTPFVLGGWHHVAGVYDGATMTLYIDGEVAATSEVQSGDIVYPPKTFYELGAYRDSNEHHRLAGAIHEIVVYGRALTAAQVGARHTEKAGSFPAPKQIVPESETIKLAEGPWMTFVNPHEARAHWRTAEPVPTRLVARLGDEKREFVDAKPKTEHAVTLDRLGRNHTYKFTIEVDRDGATQRTAEYECENFFNYSVRPVPEGAAIASAADRAAAQRIVKETGIGRGIAVVYGADRASLAAGLVAVSDLRVIVVDRDERAIANVRRRLIDAGVYGARIEARVLASDDAVVYDAMFANLIVVTRGDKAAAASAKRIAQPARGVVLSLDTNGAIAERWNSPPLPGAGTWTHQYGATDNSAFGGETLGGAAGAEAMRVQWIGRPGPRYQSDREHRDSAPLAAGGRLFVQGWKRLIALDQYNGTILWSLELPEVVRFNVTRDCANWCVDDRHVYLAAGATAWVIDAATGAIVDRRATVTPESSGADQKWDWGYIARTGDLLVGSSAKKGAAFTEMWGGEFWFDERKDGNALTAVVASDALFARKANGGELAWRYDGGLVVNSTVTIADGRVHFVEVRSKADLDAATRRLHSATMWKDMHLVALDLKTGERLWEQKLDVPRGFSIVTAHGADRLAVVVSSNRGSFDAYGFEPATGKQVWKAETPWENKGEKGVKAGHHGSHLQRPAIVGDRMYLRPGIFNIRTGERIATLKKPGHGCGTYAATAYSLIFRNESMGMWDIAGDKHSTWSRLRPDCWLSTIPAGGMILSPEGGGGCSCGSWLETSLGFAPRRVEKPKK